MINRNLTMLGVGAMVVGALLLAAQSFGAGGGITAALAGNTSPTSDPTAPASTPTPGTVTPVTVVRTATPNATSTAIPDTATSVPPTEAPTTAPPPAPTQPSSGNEGVAVQPPNTGSGGSTGGSTGVWMMVLGALAVVAGSGAVFAGARRR